MPAAAGGDGLGAVAAPSPRVRFSGLDAGRFVAAGGIVWLHGMAINPRYGWVADAARFVVPFFTFAAMVMLGESVRRARLSGKAPAFGAYCLTRLLRIYVPFLVWSAVYFLLRDAKYLLRGTGTRMHFDAATFVVGTAHHLWFLPFILVLSIAAYPVAWVLVRGGGWGRGMALVALVCGGVVCAIPEPISFSPAAVGAWNEMAYTAALAWRTLPCAFWGLAAIAVFPKIVALVAGRPGVGLMLLVAVGVCMAAAMRDERAFDAANVGGACFFLCSLAVPEGVIVGRLARGGKYAYSIYLVHVAILLGLDAALVKNRAAVPASTLLVMVAIAFMASLAFSVVAPRVKALKWAMP